MEAEVVPTAIYDRILCFELGAASVFVNSFNESLILLKAIMGMGQPY